MAFCFMVNTMYWPIILQRTQCTCLLFCREHYVLTHCSVENTIGQSFQVVLVLSNICQMNNILGQNCAMIFRLDEQQFQVVRAPVLGRLTLSLLGYLKTRICWGGVNLTPPSNSHVLCQNMTNDTSLESSCALLLESAKKFANLQKLNFLSQNSVIQ